MAVFKVIVTTKAPKKLGAFLLENGFSHKALNNIKNHNGMILVNHRRRYVNYDVRLGDEILVVPGVEKENPWLQASNQPFAVVQETANYLVVNKPAGILSIPSRYDNRDAVVNRAMGYFAEKNEAAKPHIVTRLDRDTAGLVLVGKNAVAHARFSKIPKTKFVKKYHAIVHGNFAGTELARIIDAPIARADTGVKRCVSPNGKAAKTEYRVLKQVDGASLVELRLFTGRTHQIRVHMQYLGHPLFGDRLYGQEDGLKHQALNCFCLVFPDPFGSGQQNNQIEDPLEMKQLWQSFQ